MDVEDGKSKLKLTIATYHRPSGKNIHRSPGDDEKAEWGVKPNDGYEVKFNNEQLIQYQIARQKRDARAEGFEKIEFDDTQLDKAIEYLREEIAKARRSPRRRRPDRRHHRGNAESPASPPGFLPLRQMTTGTRSS